MSKYDFQLPFVDGLARVQLNEKFGIINEKYEELIKPKYDYIGEFYFGFAKVRIGYNWSYINNNLEEICSFGLETVIKISKDK